MLIFRFQLIGAFICLSLLQFSFPVSGYAQLRLDTLKWRSPLNIPLFLSGNFAELRSDHFHSGIDLKTQGKEGFKVYAVYDGYISRIKISTGGYGKSLYITHPDGYTSVYAHMKEFNIQIDKFVRSKQYDSESYEIDIPVSPETIPIKKGEVIGLSGNTGSSGGPHLHFEIRKTKNSEPLNGLFLGFPIKDSITPRLYTLWAYPQDRFSSINQENSKQWFGLVKKNGSYGIAHGDTLVGNGRIGFGIKANDYLNGTTNRCGIYDLKLWFDGKLLIEETLNGFRFDETRYINSLMDYEENVDNNIKIYKLFVDPNNKLSIYPVVTNRGIIDLNDQKVHSVKIVTKDANKNKSTLEFYLAGEPGQIKPAEQRHADYVIPWQEGFSMDTLGFSLNFPPSSFYDTLFMNFSIKKDSSPVFYSDIYQIDKSSFPVHEYFSLAIPCYPVPDSLTEKLLMVRKDKDKFIPVNGSIYNEGKLEAKVRELGAYAVMIDTIPPTIEPLDILVKGNNLTDVSSVSFMMDDDFSGIKSYRGTIDGHWVLFEWEPKNKMITYQFDEYMPKEGNFLLQVEVTDFQGNKAVFERICVRNPL